MGMNRRVMLMQHCLQRRIEKLCRAIEKTESEFYEGDKFRGFYPVIKPSIIYMTPELKEKFIKDYKNAMQSKSHCITIIDETQM